jgi:signal-transduction protein with cAMP-binding, CBS, and nucleotidyltransferase domain
MRQVGSILVVDDGGYSLGPLTDHYLRSKVVARGLSVDCPVAEGMSQLVFSVVPGRFAFEALLAMSSHGV